MLAYCHTASSTLAPPRSQNTISSAIGAMRTAPDSPRCCRVPAPITSRAWQRTPRAANKLDRPGHLALVWLVEIHGVHQKRYSLAGRYHDCGGCVPVLRGFRAGGLTNRNSCSRKDSTWASGLEPPKPNRKWRPQLPPRRALGPFLLRDGAIIE